MADGVKAGGRPWQGVCLATTRRFLFWRIIPLPPKTSAAVAEGFAIVIHELKNRGFTCRGVVTDNASNEKGCSIQPPRTPCGKSREHVSSEFHA
jgi:hypothetical protein